MRVRRYSHLQLHVAVPAYSQVTHSVRVMQLQLPALAGFCKYRSSRYSQFTRSPTCSLLATQKSSNCNIKLQSMIKCSAKSLAPTWHTLLGMRRAQNNFFERQFWPVLVTCTLLARYLPLLAVARRCSCSYPQGSVACE